MKKQKPVILIADDEEDAREIIRFNLQKEGYKVIEAEDGEQCVKKAKNKKPDLILIDIMMPKLDGIQACKEIRSISSLKDTIIVFLTAKSEEYSQVYGFETGADDYIVKPYPPRLLVHKVGALLRRRGSLSESGDEDTSAPDTITVGPIRINTLSRQVMVGDTLTETFARKEFELLLLLMSQPSKVFRRQEILDEVWGGTIVVGSRTIDVHIKKIRKKLMDRPFIKTIKGVGYLLSIEEEE